MRTKNLIIINYIKKMNLTIISSRTILSSKLLSRKLFNIINITMFSYSRINFINILITLIKIVEQLKLIIKINYY